MRRRLLGAGAALLGAIALAGCVPGEGAPTPGPSGTAVPPASTASPDPGATVTPSAPAQSGAIPTDCRDVVAPDRYRVVFEGTPLNDPAFVGEGQTGVLTPTAPPSGASAEEILSSATLLRCVWRDPSADITGIFVDVARVDVDVASAHLDELAATGYTCADKHNGRACQLVKPNEMYPVDEGHTYFLRDDVYISVQQFNYPTNDLLGDIAAIIWR